MGCLHVLNTTGMYMLIPTTHSFQIEKSNHIEMRKKNLTQIFLFKEKETKKTFVKHWPEALAK